MTTKHNDASENARQRTRSCRQPVFNCNVKAKYTEMKNFEMEVTTIILFKYCEKHTKTILSLQYCKLIRQSNEYVKEWIDQLQSKPWNGSTRKEIEN